MAGDAVQDQELSLGFLGMESFVAQLIGDIVWELRERGLIDKSADLSHGDDFSNSTFRMMPQQWERCTCGADEFEDEDHQPDCVQNQPNFECGDIMISWYKCIGDSMTVNRQVTRQEIRDMYQKCLASIQSS
jgi:hypothetical protein